MSTIYLCVDCDLHYCVNCDGGEDACEQCSTGPRCDACAVEHSDEHAEDAIAAAEQEVEEGQARWSETGSTGRRG